MSSERIAGGRGRTALPTEPAPPGGVAPAPPGGRAPAPPDGVAPAPVPVPAEPLVVHRRVALALRPRSALALAVATLGGLAAFGWPLLAPGLAARAGSNHGGDAPYLFLGLLVLLLAVVLAEVAEGGMDAKAVALLGVLAACGAALRPLGGGVTGASPVFFLLLPAGRVLGRGFGFVLGALTLFASALLTGGVGPWLPFQMIAAGWVGFGAGCLPAWRGRAEVVGLAAYGAVAGLAFGAVMNLWFWPYGSGVGGGAGIAFDPDAPVATNLHHYAAFYLTTSLGFDIPRAVGNAGLMLLAGRPVLLALRRAARRAAFVPAGRPEQP